MTTLIQRMAGLTVLAMLGACAELPLDQQVPERELEYRTGSNIPRVVNPNEKSKISIADAEELRNNLERPAPTRE